MRVRVITEAMRDKVSRVQLTESAFMQTRLTSRRHLHQHWHVGTKSATDKDKGRIPFILTGCELGREQSVIGVGAVNILSCISSGVRRHAIQQSFQYGTKYFPFRTAGIPKIYLLKGCWTLFSRPSAINSLRSTQKSTNAPESTKS